MRRREVLASLGAGLAGGLAGCGSDSVDCPEQPIIAEGIPDDRRSLQFLEMERRPFGVEPDTLPRVEFKTGRRQVVIRGVFVGATPKSGFQKDMIVVDRLRYDEQADTLRVRLTQRQCADQGAAVAEEHTPYKLTVSFPGELPGWVCVQHGAGEAPDSTDRTCVAQK